MTITTPSGGKLRTRKSTRYAIVVEHLHLDGTHDSVYIHSGSSNPETMRTKLRRLGQGGTYGNFITTRTIYDLTTGKPV